MATWTHVGIALALSAAAPARADVDPCACSPNKPGFHRASALTGDWNGVRADLFEHGVKIQGTYAGELFAAPGLADDRVVGAGLGVLSLDLDLATLIEPHLGAMHISALAIHGRGVSERLMDVYGVSNNVAGPDVRLFEAWFDQPVGPLSIRAGLLAADQQFVLAEHGTVLINATFGIVGMLSYNLGGPVYPVATPGISAELELDVVTARAAIYDGDQRNEHGIPTEIGSDALLIGEAEIAGTLKVGAWRHTARGNGYYAILDRQLERRVGAFFRAGASPREPLNTYLDAGIRIGPGPLRPRDFMSVGLAFARTDRGAQTVIEATYQALINGWLTIQPDTQLVFTAGRTAGVLAIRAVVAL